MKKSENTMKDDKTKDKEKSMKMRGSKRRKKSKAELERSLDWKCLSPEDKEYRENHNPHLQYQYWTTKNRAYVLSLTSFQHSSLSFT